MVTSPILTDIASNWWVLALRGVIALLFAVCAFLWPGLTLGVLVILWGAFALVDGIVAVVVGARSHWWWLLFFGVLGIAVGVFTLFRPEITALALLIVIAAWAIVRGAFEIAAAVRLRKELSNEWLLIVGGLVSIAFGILVTLVPGAGALAIVWMIGVYAVVIGILMLTLAFRLRGLARHREPRPAM
jgi:uncharacterized membrane protein HdeD (DUF308 family)